MNTAWVRPDWRVIFSSAAAATGTTGAAAVIAGWPGTAAAGAGGAEGAPGAGAGAACRLWAAGSGGFGFGFGEKRVCQMAMTASESTKAKSNRRVSTGIRILFVRMFYGGLGAALGQVETARMKGLAAHRAGPR